MLLLQVPKNVEEIEKMVSHLDSLTQKLEDAKATAMVSGTQLAAASHLLLLL